MKNSQLIFSSAIMALVVSLGACGFRTGSESNMKDVKDTTTVNTANGRTQDYGPYTNDVKLKTDPSGSVFLIAEITLNDSNQNVSTYFDLPLKHNADDSFGNQVTIESNKIKYNVSMKLIVKESKKGGVTYLQTEAVVYTERVAAENVAKAVQASAWSSQDSSTTGEFTEFKAMKFYKSTTKEFSNLEEAFKFFESLSTL